MLMLVYPFLALAVLGSAGMLAIHVTALFGITYPFEHLIKFLVPGVFLVFLPTIFVMNQLARDVKQKDLWRAALRGCPQWMRRALWIVIGYVWLGAFALPFLYGGGMNSPANTARAMSGGLLAFYLIPAAVLYSATQVRSAERSRRCPNGHRISPFAKYCEECGAPADLRMAPPDS